jgi:hypothetical protein
VFSVSVRTRPSNVYVVLSKYMRPLGVFICSTKSGLLLTLELMLTLASNEAFLMGMMEQLPNVLSTTYATPGKIMLCQ